MNRGFGGVGVGFGGTPLGDASSVDGTRCFELVNERGVQARAAQRREDNEFWLWLVLAVSPKAHGVSVGPNTPGPKASKARRPPPANPRTRSIRRSWCFCVPSCPPRQHTRKKGAPIRRPEGEANASSLSLPKQGQDYAFAPHLNFAPLGFILPRRPRLSRLNFLRIGRDAS